MSRRLLPLAAALLILPLLLVAGCRNGGGDDDIIHTTVIEGEIVTDADTVDEGDLVTFHIPDDHYTSGATVDGFRVQLLAATNEGRARDFAREAEAKLGVPVYVEYEGGYWKVRAGDCATRSQAEDLRSRARTAGYADAWIAATRIAQ